MLKPLHDQVVLKQHTPEKKTKSGIILTENDTKTPSIATVIAVGPGDGEKKMAVQNGDTVVYKSFATTDIEYDGEDYLIISQDDILAIVEED